MPHGGQCCDLSSGQSCEPGYGCCYDGGQLECCPTGSGGAAPVSGPSLYEDYLYFDEDAGGGDVEGSGGTDPNYGGEGSDSEGS